MGPLNHIVAHAAGPISSLKARLWRNEKGVMAVELGLSLPIFLTMVVGIMEMAWFFFIAGSLENAILHASRYGITGYETEGRTREEIVLDIVAEQTFGKVDMDRLALTTEVYQQFAEIDVPEPYEDANSNGQWDTGEVFTDVNGNGLWDESLAVAGLGGGNDIVLYRVSYDPGSLTGFFDWATRLAPIEATMAVRNEPY